MDVHRTSKLSYWSIQVCVCDPGHRVCEFKRIVSCRRTESKAIQAGGDDVYNDWMLL